MQPEMDCFSGFQHRIILHETIVELASVAIEFMMLKLLQKQVSNATWSMSLFEVQRFKGGEI